MRKSSLNAGQQHGHITLLERLAQKDRHGSLLWKCRCICGASKIVSSRKVRRGDSCGCIASACRESKTLVGKQYGRLLVVKKLDEVDGSRGRHYLCLCECGQEKSISSTSLRTGTKSCGCLAVDRGVAKLSRGEAAFNQLYAYYKWYASKRNLTFNLTSSDFHDLTKKNCTYCGASPHQVRRLKGGNGEYKYNGIDRVDSKRGYALENCVPCCGVCNSMKSDMAVSDFLDHVARIARMTVTANPIRAVAGG